MQALAASCEELRARTGNPPLDEFPVSDGNEEIQSSNMNSAIELITKSNCRVSTISCKIEGNF